MQNKIALLTREVEYTFRISARARNLRITIFDNGRVIVTAPPATSQDLAERFLLRKAHWVVEKLEHFKNIPQRNIIEVGRNGFERYKERALALARERVAHFNALYKVKVRRISIRNQRARWGSCSQKGNLSFNYKIAALPSEVTDYVIVHELCHLLEMNHSKAFWVHVERTLPHWRALRQQLKKTIVR